MIIKAKKVQAKTEYTRKRNKCPCCTRLNCREHILQKIRCKEANSEILMVG